MTLLEGPVRFRNIRPVPRDSGPVSQGVVDLLSSILSCYERPDEAYDALGGQLTAIVEAHDPELSRQLVDGRATLDGGSGHFVLRGTGIDTLDYPLAQLTAIALSAFFGRPSRPSPTSPVIAWPIDYREESGTPGVTFSQTNAEATMHTDSQYFPEPESYFGLFCLTPAADGGGTSQIVEGSTLRAALSILEDRQIVDELGKPFPFRVPNIFTKGREPEITWAPILSPDAIRYRRDTLMDALEVDGVAIPEAQFRALGIFEDVLASVPVKEYRLEAGDVLFVHNHRVLHGRTSFEDPGRLMLRVRLR